MVCFTKILNNVLEELCSVKSFYLIFFILILIICTGFSDKKVDIKIAYQPNVERLEAIFKAYIPLKDGVIYTKVPRGLIVSVDEKVFFSACDTRIKESSLYILDVIIILLQKLQNYCVIESHTDEAGCNDCCENWELSTIRAQNIAEYISVHGKISTDKLNSNGFGRLMPFKDNVSSRQNGFDNRIDFVIIEYGAKR